jgi:hypothetical protein
LVPTWAIVALEPEPEDDDETVMGESAFGSSWEGVRGVVTDAGAGAEAGGEVLGKYDEVEPEEGVRVEV